MDFRIYHLTYLFGLFPWVLSAQSAGTDMVLQDKVFPAIEARLEQLGGDTARYFILQQVRSHCGTDDNCQYKAYHELMLKQEQRFNLPMAIFVGEEMVKVAQRQGNLREEATTYRHLVRYHNALGNSLLAFKNSEKALSLFKQLGDGAAIAHTQMAMLEFRLSFRKFEDVLPEMKALLHQAVTDRDTLIPTQIHVRLIFLSKTAGMYEKNGGTCCGT